YRRDIVLLPLFGMSEHRLPCSRVGTAISHQGGHLHAQAPQRELLVMTRGTCFCRQVPETSSSDGDLKAKRRELAALERAIKAGAVIQARGDQQSRAGEHDQRDSGCCAANL